MKMLTLCFEVEDTPIAQAIAAKNAAGFDAHGLQALLDVGTVVEARLLAIPRPDNTAAPLRYASMLLCTSYEGPQDTYFEEFYRRLPHEFCGLGIAAKDKPFAVTPELVRVVTTHDTSPAALALLQSLFEPFAAWVRKNDLTGHATPVSAPSSEAASHFIRAETSWPPTKLSIGKGQTLADNLFVVLHDETLQADDGKVRKDVVDEIGRIVRAQGLSSQDLKDVTRIAGALQKRGDVNAAWIEALGNPPPSVRAARPGDLPRESRLPCIAWEDSQDSPDEIAKFREQLSGIQALLRQKMPGERMPHGFHEKQHFGGLARVEVTTDIPEFLRGAPFEPGNVLGALVRFSNGSGCPMKDAAPDVRAIALKMFGPDSGEVWDALLTNQRATHTKTADQGIVFGQIVAEVVTSKEADPAKREELLKTRVVQQFGPAEAKRILEQLEHDTVKHRVDSLTTETYYGGTFQTANGLLCRLVLKPFGNNEPIAVNREQDDDWLATELAAQLERGPVRMRLFVQVYAGDGEQPSPADASAPWLSPEYEVAEVKIENPRGDARDQLPELVKRVAFNPATGFLPAHLTHARKSIYEQSAKNRDAMSAEGARLLWERFGARGGCPHRE